MTLIFLLLFLSIFLTTSTLRLGDMVHQRLLCLINDNYKRKRYIAPQPFGGTNLNSIGNQICCLEVCDIKCNDITQRLALDENVIYALASGP